MNAASFSKTGDKATAAAKLDKYVFEADVSDHQLLKQAYVAYLANGRSAAARTKTRGLVSGGGRKPWRQKGTGRARFGSSRNPIWTGGGVAFGPNGQQNYKQNLPTIVKRQALRQALTLAAKDGQLIVLETFDSKEPKVKKTLALLDKIGATGNTLLVIEQKDNLVERATRNIARVKVIQADYLNVYDVLNAKHVVVSQKALTLISERLGKTAKNTPAKQETTA